MFKRNAGSGSGKKFGGKDFKNRAYGPKGGFGDKGGFGSNEMHDAICAKCGDKCQVPFKPNGRKPILCTSCFRQDEGGQSEGVRGAFGRPKFAEKRSYGSPAPQGNGQMEKRLDEVNVKLDRIIRELETLKELKV